jgi:hypothetical protein
MGIGRQQAYDNKWEGGQEEGSILQEEDTITRMRSYGAINK